MESGLLYNPTMKQTNLRAGCKSALQPGTMTGRRSETFEELLYLFSSEDKYKGSSCIKRKIDRWIGINYSSVNFRWTQVFLCYQSFDSLGARNFSCAVSGFGQVSQVNEFFKNTGHTR